MICGDDRTLAKLVKARVVSIRLLTRLAPGMRARSSAKRCNAVLQPANVVTKTKERR
jgi:hypothetical protein